MTEPRKTPKCGEVWWVDLEPVKGREQGGRRPCLIVSVDEFNRLPHGLVWTVPITSNIRFKHAFAVTARPPDGGLKVESLILAHQLRTLSTERLAKRAGVIPNAVFDEVKKRLALALGF
ncbi:MAG: type II toxin-antitoxin system PemK/MazF family toxin [Myxococcales bacterium]|nr:MAG: type II toxin-antitoxin system PemK/MazF family toxin [Myxococcales bacterium]